MSTAPVQPPSSIIWRLRTATGAARRAPRLALAAAATSLLLGVASCSAIKLVYNNMDEAAYWWLDGYVDVEQAQAPRLRQELAKLLRWHRSNELPKFTPLLQTAEQLAQAPSVSPEALCQLTDAVRERLAPVALQVEAAAAPLALTLQPSQLTAMAAKYKRVNADWREDWIDPAPAKVLARRAKRDIERAEDLYGRLDASQRELLRQHAARSMASPRIDDAERVRRQNELLAVLTRIVEEKPAPAEAQARLHTVIGRLLASPDPAVRSHYAALQQESCRNAAALHATVSPAQRERAIERLRGWQRDVVELASQ